MKQKQLQRELDKASAEVEGYVEAGSRAFLVAFNYLDVCGGFLSSFKADIPAFADVAQKHLLGLGLNVRGVSRDEWNYTLRFECEVPVPVEATKKCPMCAETIKAEAVVCRYCGSQIG